MPQFTRREAEIIDNALRIAAEDGSIYPTGLDSDEDDKLRDKVRAEIEAIRRKLSL